MTTVIETLMHFGEFGASLIARYPAQATELLGFAVVAIYATVAVRLARNVLGGAR